MTRRQALVATGVLAGSRATYAKASQPSTPVDFEVPPHACDCHTHIFADPAKFPFWPGRTYTPETALPDEMLALHRALHIERVVIVTPSVYGADNSATLYGLKARGATARGVGVIDEHTHGRELDAMYAAGVRGVRINLATLAQNDPTSARRRLRAAAARIRGLGWHIQMYANASLIPSLKQPILDESMPVVFDHFGGVKAALGLEQPGFGDLIELLRSGHAYVKLSGAYRASAKPPDYSDVVPFAKALIDANPDRVVWGTDWPHPDTAGHTGGRPMEITPLLPIDDGRLLDLLPVWAPDPSVRKKILVDNPARLYEF